MYFETYRCIIFTQAQSDQNPQVDVDEHVSTFPGRHRSLRRHTSPLRKVYLPRTLPLATCVRQSRLHGRDVELRARRLGDNRDSGDAARYLLRTPPKSYEARCTTAKRLPIPCTTTCHVCAPDSAAWPNCGASRASSWGPPCPPIIVGAPSMEESRVRSRDSVLPRWPSSPAPSRVASSMGGCTESRQQRAAR